MRILHWTDSYFPTIGGMQTFLRDLCRAQKRCGHEVAVAAAATPGSPPAEEMDGIPVRRGLVSETELASDPRLMGRLVESCRAIKREFRPERIHLHGSHLSGWLHLLSREAWPCPMVVTVHTTVDFFTLPRGVTIRVFRAADAVIANSASVRRDVAALCDWSEDRVQVIYYGVAWPDEEPAPPDAGRATALCLGRMVEEKGFDVALRALALVPGARLIVAGDGMALPKLKDLAAELGLGSRVEFRGWVDPDKVPPLINEAALMLMPSRWEEAFGLVAVQAAQMGRPIVASRVGGIPEVVEHGVTGLLVPRDDPEAMAAGLRDLLEDRRRASAMGARARERARERFAIERCAAEYEAIYERAREARE